MTGVTAALAPVDPLAVAGGVLASLAVLLRLAVRCEAAPGARLARALAPRPHAARDRRAAAVAPVPGAAATAVLADQIAGLVRAGLPAARIWHAMADRAADPAVRALASEVLAGRHRGRTPGETLRAVLVRHEDARHEKGGALRQLVVALDVSERTGAALAVTLLRLAEALRQDETAAQERASALAGPRASALVLSLLPLAGLGLGGLLGGAPVHVLLGTAPGRACLLAGGSLWLFGRWWTTALVRRAATAR